MMFSGTRKCRFCIRVTKYSSGRPVQKLNARTVLVDILERQYLMQCCFCLIAEHTHPAATNPQPS